MIRFSDVQQVNSSPLEFLRKAILHNMENYPRNNGGNGYQFFKYMHGLMPMGSITTLMKDYKFRLYSQMKDYVITGSKIEVIYLIDETGLSHYEITCPNKYINVYGSETGLVYNPGSPKYNCLDKLTIDQEEANIKYLKENILPFPGKEMSLNVYVKKEFIDGQYDEYSPRIYRTSKRSFFLPFEELLRKHLELENWTLKVKPEFMEESISFRCIYEFKTRKHDNWKIWEGRISYETFEILDIELVDSISEYNW